MLELFWLLLGAFTFFFIGFSSGYKEGREHQKEILVRLRKTIANNQG